MQLFFLYVDPGSGSYLVQIIVAAILGTLFYFKSLWWRVKAFFGGKSKSKKKDDSLNDSTDA